MAGAQADPMQRLGVILNNVAETIGVALIPYLDKAAKWLGTFIMQMQDGTGAGGAFANKVKTIAAAYVAWVKFAFGKVGVAIDWIRANWDTISATFMKVVAVVKTQVVGAFRALNTSKGDMIAFGRAVMNIAKVVIAILWPVVRRVFPAILQTIRGALQVIGGVIKVFAGVFTGDWRRAWEGLKQIVSGALNLVIGAFRQWTAPFRQVAASIGNAIKNVFKGAFDWIVDKINWVLDKVGAAKDAVDAIIPGGSGGPSTSDIGGAVGDAIGGIAQPGSGDRPDAGARPKIAPRIGAPKIAPVGPIDLGFGGDTHWQPLVVAIDNVPIARATGKAIRRRQNRS
jgi:hypothetical protein